MNDYDTINNLLEDGSQQSLLKLKMIVDFNNFDISEINYNYRFNFAVCFKDYYEKFFSNRVEVYEIGYFPTCKRIEVFNLFLDSFKISIDKHNFKGFINYFQERDYQYIKAVFRNL